MYENKIRAGNNVRFQAWVDGQTEKITRCLNRLELEASRGTLKMRPKREVATAAERAVAAGVGIMDIVRHEWRTDRPHLTGWFAHW